MNLWPFSPILFAAGFSLLYTKWIATRISGVLFVVVALAIAWVPDDADDWYMAIFLAAAGGVALFVYPPRWFIFATNTGATSSRRRFAQFDLKKLFIFVAFMSVLFAAVGYRRSSRQNRYAPLNRSWQSGTVVVEIYEIGAEKGVRVLGNWPDATDEQWIRFNLWLTQDNSNDRGLLGGQQRLLDFRSCGVSDYSDLRKMDRSRAYRAVFDYEIWDGRPDQGKLLKKDSVFSEPFVESEG